HYQQLRKLPAMLLGLAGHAPKDSYRQIGFLERRDPVGEYLFYRGYYTPAQTARLLGCTIGYVREKPSQIRVPEWVGRLRGGNRVSWLESNLYMQHQLLRDTDNMSMWHAVEVRVPFLGRDFIDVVHRISPQLKFGHEIGKYLLIEAFEDILPRE